MKCGIAVLVLTLSTSAQTHNLHPTTRISTITKTTSA